MKIFFDHQTFSTQNFGGISRYIAELVKGINSDTSYEAYLALLFSNNIHLKEMGLPAIPFMPYQHFPKKQSIIYRLNQQYCKLQLSRKKYDIFHATYYDPYFIPFLKGKPFVVTFYDMIFERLGNRFKDHEDNTLGSQHQKQLNEIKQQKKILAACATRIIAISENTKKDIIDLFHVNPSKIDVIYLGSSIVSSLTSKPYKKDLYLLFVGNRGHYKNFLALLQATAKLLRSYNLTLICAGGGPFTAHEQAFIQSLGIYSQVKHQHIASDAMLQALYESALAFIFPSLYEGFGIPILEAFACKCPCLLSNTSSLPEVGGEAALYFDPQNLDSIAQAVERIVIDSDLRSQLISKGTQRLKAFLWENTIQETIAVYEKC